MKPPAFVCCEGLFACSFAAPKDYMDKLKKITTKVLLAFVFISIGFAFGRNSAKRTPEAISEGNGSVGDVVATADAPHLVVYYTHGMIRCAECNNIEKTTHSILERDFKDELASGTIRWKVVNFQEDAKFAEKFDVAASGVILAVVKDGKVVKIEKLEKVWTLIDSPEKFKTYIEDAIRENLKY